MTKTHCLWGAALCKRCCTSLRGRNPGSHPPPSRCLEQPCCSTAGRNAAPELWWVGSLVPGHLLGVFQLSHHLSEHRRGAKLTARALLPGKVSAPMSCGNPAWDSRTCLSLSPRLQESCTDWQRSFPKGPRNQKETEKRKMKEGKTLSCCWKTCL